MVAQIFESTPSSSEATVFENFSNRHLPKSAKIASSQQSSKKMKVKSSRDSLDNEPAKIGEQVQII